MTNGTASIVKVVIIAALVITCGLIDCGTAHAKEVISASLVADHFQMSDNEMIVGGYLTITGGTFETHIPSQEAWSIIKGPLHSRLVNDPRSGTTTLLFSVFLTGPSDDSNNKKRQLVYLSDWFDIDISGSSRSLICPSKECPIEIEGELELGDPESAAYNKTSPRKVKVTTTDFIFHDVTIDISGLRSKAEKGDIKAQYELGNLYSDRAVPGVKMDAGKLSNGIVKPPTKVMVQPKIKLASSMAKVWVCRGTWWRLSNGGAWLRIMDMRKPSVTSGSPIWAICGQQPAKG